jgi:hypothetical protein
LRLACEKAGVIPLLVGRLLRSVEIKSLIRQSLAVGAIIPWKFRNFDYVNMIEEMQAELPSLKYIFIVGDEVPSGKMSIKEMISQLRKGLEEYSEYASIDSFVTIDEIRREGDFFILKGKKVTCFDSPASNREMKLGGAVMVNKPVVIDGSIITADGPVASKDFADTVIRTLSSQHN